MKQGHLSDFFEGVAVKHLAAVDADPGASHQHEVTGSEPLLKILGEQDRKGQNRFFATYIWMGGEQDAISEEGRLSWYDSRRNDPTRSAEWRLYYQTNAVTQIMQPGNTLFVARRKNDHILFIVTPENSTVESQLLWLFGIKGQLTLHFSLQDITTENAAALDFTTRYILDELGIEFEDPNANSLDAIIERFGSSFPRTSEFSQLARLTLPDVQPLDDPDQALVAWLDHEEALFRRLERRVVAERLEQGFASDDQLDVDGFLYFSLQVQNRRKSRMGFAFEHHLSAIFDIFNLAYQRQGKTERGNTVDFLFPGMIEYQDATYSADRLIMLAAKSSCKERWRQALAEADRIWPKHLITLEPAITPNQTEQMQAQQLQLVVPRSIQQTYQPAQRNWLWTLSDFIQLVRRKQT